MTVKVDNKGRNISRLVIVSGKQFFDEKKRIAFLDHRRTKKFDDLADDVQ